MSDKIELRITNERNPNYVGCFKCKYYELPDEACKIIGCIHAIGNLREWYTEREGYTEVEK